MKIDKREVYSMSDMEFEDIEIMCIGLEFVIDNIDYTDTMRDHAKQVLVKIDDIIPKKA